MNGMITVYKVYEDGMIGSVTFLYRDEEIQSYYVGVRCGADRQPCISGKSVQEIAAVNYTPKGYFIYEDKNPMLHASAFSYFRISPIPDECRNLKETFVEFVQLTTKLIVYRGYRIVNKIKEEELNFDDLNNLLQEIGLEEPVITKKRF